MLMPDEAMARRYIELGCTFMAVGADVVLLAQGARALAAKYRAGA
jgi:4-hydroxy-2-oxoheptanedioate aldolase